MAESSSKYPEVQGGGSLIIAWQVRGKKVLVVGGGEVGCSEFGCHGEALFVSNLYPSY